MASLVRWDPLGELLGVRHDFGRLLGDLGWMRPPMTGTTGHGAFVPNMDVFSRNGDLVMRAELPGIAVGDVDISVTDDILTVTAERREDTEVEEGEYLVRESRFGTMERSIRLPEGAEVDRIRAEYRDGILEITVPKAAPAEHHTHKIAIESHPSSAELEERH